MNGGQILIVPAVEKGKGGGHLCRCITLTADLRIAGRKAWLFLSAKTEETDRLLKSMNFNPEWRITESDLKRICADSVEYIILDRFQTPCEELLRWKKIAPTIGIDEGGKDRDSFDFLIDILTPEKLISPKANVYSPSLLKFPAVQRSQKKNDGILRVLISFGQEDLSGLGIKTARELSAMNTKQKMEITLLRGVLAKQEIEQLPNVKVIENIPRLAEHLGEYDLVITHYGITAFESLYAKTPVLLASPTKHHAKVAKTAGFITWEWGVGNGEWNCCLKSIRIRNLLCLLTSFPTPYSLLPTPHFLKKLKKRCEKLALKFGLDKKGVSLCALCGGLLPQVNRTCPVCGADSPQHSVGRFSERTYRRCSNCGTIYMDRICPPSIEYQREYFFESYTKQYGKTYLEDFDNIKASGKRRAKIINSLLPAETEKTLLDIGCAYGPFLSAAKEEGFLPSGIEPAQDAVRYVQEKLGIPIVQGFFPHSPLPTPHSPYNAVTLWFVIEHFTDCKTVLAEIKKILKPGGIFAFSTPSFSGISGRSSIRKFLSASPADHRTVWSPKMCRKALAFYGFKVKKIAIAGHHPERFPLLGKLAKSKKSPLYLPLLAISKLFSLGDTFEVYAELKKG